MPASNRFTAMFHSMKAPTLCMLLLLTLLPPSAALSQKTLIDSLIRVAEAAPDDTTRGNTLCKLCGAYRNAGDFNKARTTGERGLALIRPSGNANKITSCMLALAEVYKDLAEYRKGIQLSKESFEISRKAGDQRQTGRSLLKWATLLRQQGDYTQALRRFYESLAILEEHGEPRDVAAVLNNMGNVYREQEDYDKALDCYRRSLVIREKLGDPTDISTGVGNLGNVYFKQGKYEEALKYYEESLAWSLKGGQSNLIADRQSKIGRALDQLGQRERALQHHLESLRLHQTSGAKMHEGNSNADVAATYLHMKRPAQAHAYARVSLKLAQEIGNLESMLYGSQIAYQVDSALGDWRGAFQYLLLHKQYADTLKNDHDSKEMGRLESKYEFEKQAEIERRQAEEEKRLDDARTNWMLGSAAGGFLCMFIIAFTLFQSRKRTKRANVALRALNERISTQKAEIEAINAELQATLDEVNEQRGKLQEQHQQIEDSIRYASRIQHAILPSRSQMKQHMPAHFIHYQPRDIVSGDFYWMTRLDDKVFFAVVDCTGHGVPGAFMSVVGHSLLNQIVNETGITRPPAILKALDRRIMQQLHQQAKQGAHDPAASRDGMDLALIVLHAADANGNRTVEYAGAGRPLWLLAGSEIVEYRSGRHSCGGSQHLDKEYPTLSIEARPGDRLYLFSDGVADQFGGPNGRKLGSKALQAALLTTSAFPIEEQGEAFNRFFSDWMSGRRQLDDVLLAGMEV